MIDALRSFVATVPVVQRLNAVREYVQWLVLQAMDEGGFRPHLIFTGGTCLRVVHGIQRFSEDLDFSLATGHSLTGGKLSADLQKRLTRWGLTVESTPVKEEKTVISFFLRFPGVLHALRISSQKGQKLSIKVEADKRPPVGGLVEEYYHPGPLSFLVNHFDLPSLFATKLHAVLFRGFEKGRDYYDLLFFLGRTVEPNWTLFSNAVGKTDPHVRFSDEGQMWDALRNKISTMNEDRIRRDVQPFLLKPEEDRFLTRAVLLKAVERAGAYRRMAER